MVRKVSGEDDTLRDEDSQSLGEEQYRLIVENANEAIVVAQDERLKFANPKTEEITGYSRRELIDRPFKDVIHPDDLQLVAERHRRRLAGESLPHVYSFRIARKDGGVRWVEINAVRFEWEGRPATLNFLKDISERVSAEEGRRASEDKFSSVFHSAPLLMAISTVDEGRFIDVNETFEKVTGYSAAAITGRTSVELGLFDDPEDRSRIRRRIDRGETVSGEEITIKCKSGKCCSLLFSARIINIEGGECWLTTALDISDRKHAEEEIRESRRRFEIAARCASDLIYVWDVASDRLEWHGDIDGIMGYGPNEFPRTIAAWVDQIHPDDRPRLMKEIEHHRNSGEPIDTEYRIRRKDGRYLHWTDRGEVLRSGDGENLALVGVCSDVTEQREARERLLESERKFRGFYESIGDGMALTDVEGKLLDMNEVFAEMLGYSREELLGTNFKEFTPERWWEEERDFVENTVYRRGRGEFEKEYTRKDGTVFPVSVRYWVVRDDAGQSSRVWALAHDVTDKRETEREMARKMGEVEKLNKFMVGRELRIIDMKKQINELLERLGEPPRFKV